MQVEAHGEPVVAGPGQRILAAQVCAVGAEIEAAVVDQSQAARESVMAGVDPGVAVGFATVDGHLARAVAQPAAGQHLRRVDILHRHRRMGGGGALRASPVGHVVGMCAAIDHETFLADADLHTQRAGMGVPVERRRRRGAGVHDDQGAVCGEPLESAMGCRVERLAACLGAGQYHVDEPAFALGRIVEQRQPPVTVPPEAQHRRHAVDCGLQFRRHFRPPVANRGTDVDQMPQYRKLNRRAALHMPAIAQDLAVDLPFE